MKIYHEIKGGCASKPLLFILFGFYILMPVYSGDFTVYRDKEFGKKIHLHFNTPVSFSPRGRTDFQHPDFKETFYPGVNFRFGMTGMYNFNAHYSFSLGLNLYGISFNSMRHRFFIPEKYLELIIDPVPDYYQGDIYPIEKFDPYQLFWSFPLNFLHRIPVCNKIDFRYGLGIDLKLFISADIYKFSALSDPDGNILADIHQLYYRVGNDKNAAFRSDALFSAGINRYLKNNKYINFNFFLSVPMYKPIRGEFIFLKRSLYEARGTFKKTDLAFGFEFNYVFTFIKRDKNLKGNKKINE
jgi:hypothetical protein